ncbi:growth hormone secretagogue receptor type 1-like isoform X2 [Homalodisca vitripennis]|uniref:growth hormone secretagogue receptor type 1-like isoform X2 n=1 Tax=Homalodisca vitripennis TaxID=197043 RepID=UPI001EEC8939|nr:growth hormone secretagogue receptor type 1-like isoform X2 [Homalodisca vitripennis]
MISSLVAGPENNTTYPYFFTNSSVGPVTTPSNATNGSDFESPVFPAYIRTTSIIFCVIILGIGVIGNVMVPLVILKSKDMRNSTNIFLMNLSIADLMVLLVCTPTVLVEVNSKPETWVLGKEMCKAVPFVELTVAHASVLTILAISFERYYAICEPLKAGYVCTKARAMVICLLAWALAALFTSPILVVAEYRYAEYFDGSMVPVCLTQADSFWPAFFFLFIISLFFGLPLAILMILYSVIACHLMANPGIVAPSAHSAALRYRRQVVMMLGTVVVSFFLCLLPFRAFTLWIIIESPETVQSLGIDGYYKILYFSRIMLYLNSAVNPILYNLMSSKFRDGFRRLLGFKATGKDLLNRKGTITTTTTTVTNSSQKRLSTDGRSLKRSVVRVLSKEDRKRSIDLGFTTKIKRLGQTKGFIKSDESFV